MPGRVAISSEQVSKSDDESSESSASSDAGRSSGGTSAPSTFAQKRKSTTALASSSKRKKGTEKTKETAQPPVSVTLETSGSGSDSENGSEDGEGSGSGSGSGESSSDDASDSEDASPARTNGISSQQSNAASPSRSQSAPKKSYQPPPGFERAKAASRSNPTLDQLFLPSNLAGKQVWHITVPSSVPIDTLKEVDLGIVKNGKTVLSHNGMNYGFVSERGASAKPSRLLIAGEAGKVYRPASSNFTEVLHLQQIVGRSSGTAAGGSEAAAPVPLRTVKEVRQQPAGLRVRFWPVGFEQGDVTRASFRHPTMNGANATGSDSEATDSEAQENRSKRRKTGLAGTSKSAKSTAKNTAPSSSDSDTASESDKDSD